jgi:hypothetical protein
MGPDRGPHEAKGLACHWCMAPMPNWASPSSAAELVAQRHHTCGRGKSISFSGTSTRLLEGMEWTEGFPAASGLFWLPLSSLACRVLLLFGQLAELLVRSIGLNWAQWPTQSMCGPKIQNPAVSSALANQRKSRTHPTWCCLLQSFSTAVSNAKPASPGSPSSDTAASSHTLNPSSENTMVGP